MSSTPFLWVPGAGHDPDALERIRSRFPCPRAPMGEAGFMGAGRRMFPELAGDLGKLCASELQRPLAEIARGTSCFGRQQEWTDWYHYLLGQLVPRSHEHFVDSLLDYLVTGFMVLYPTGDEQEPYAGFKEDALRTIGLCMMDACCWDGGEIRLGALLHRSNDNPSRVWCWWDASGDFAASMFFCLKYLPGKRVAGWLDSVLAIRSPHWRAQVLVWLLGARDLLTGKKRWPCELAVGQVPAASWAWSHCLGAELLDEGRTEEDPHARFIPQAVGSQVLAQAQQYFTPDRFLEWLASIERVPYVREELANLPRDFEALYVRGDAL